MMDGEREQAHTRLIVAVALGVERRLIRLDPDAHRQDRRMQRLQDDEDLCVDAYQQQGVPGLLHTWWRIVEELVVCAGAHHVRTIRTTVTGGGRMNIHDPQVHKQSGVTFRRAVQTLLCLVLMQLSTTAMVDAEHAGLVVLEALMMVVVAASIVGCFVATGLEMWAMGKLGKALLDSRG